MSNKYAFHSDDMYGHIVDGKERIFFILLQQFGEMMTCPSKSYSLIWSKNVKWEGIGFGKANVWAYLGKHIKKKMLALLVGAYVI